MRRWGLCLAIAAGALALAIAAFGRGPAGASDVDAVAAGGAHTCALEGDGTARCWGANSSGQLGNGAGGATGDLSAVPIDVAGLSGAVTVEAGGAHSCALLAGGSVACWGQNASGQLGAHAADGCTLFPGNPPVGCAKTPVAVPGLSDVIDIATGGTHTCALKGDGSVLCWGTNVYGQLGAPTTERCPVDCATAPLEVPGASGAVDIAAGANHTCAVLAAGTVKCWGLNSQGQLGVSFSTLCGIAACSPVPVDVCADEACSSLLTGIEAVAVGASHTCALTEGGVVRCWGGNAGGQLGRGTIELGTNPVPEDVCATASCTVALAGIESIAAGGLVGSGGHTCGVRAAGGAVCWGSNFDGQLGDGYACENPCPIPVTVSGLSAVASVDAGDLHTCAVRATGVLACWGQGASGQLGDGGSGERTVPIDIAVKPSPAATPTATATPPPGLPGDASCDGRLNSIDAAFVLQHGAGLLAALPCPELADLNRDGRVNAVDAALILQIDAGLLNQPA